VGLTPHRCTSILNLHDYAERKRIYGHEVDKYSQSREQRQVYLNYAETKTYI